MKTISFETPFVQHDEREVTVLDRFDAQGVEGHVGIRVDPPAGLIFVPADAAAELAVALTAASAIELADRQ